jgi:hypothetical protein
VSGDPLPSKYGRTLVAMDCVVQYSITVVGTASTGCSAAPTPNKKVTASSAMKTVLSPARRLRDLPDADHRIEEPIHDQR